MTDSLPKKVPALKVQEDDIQIIVRKGRVHLRTPAHKRDSPVPEDFVVALGFSIAFLDPTFRNMMKALVHEQANKGMLGDIMDSHQPNAVN